MPITMDQLKKDVDSKKQKLLNVHVCSTCNTPLQETITGSRKTKKGNVCSDCYFEALGKEIDKHPIFVPKHIRGT